jgi:predicted metalloprotease with PDZ domain
MYEGLTEYFASIFQIDEGLVSEDEFYAKIMSKIQTASYYDDTMSFTVMSENVLKEPYKANYANVYQKGALIGMCLDILIREESQGQRGILSLMKELSLKYGKHKPFEDDKIIDEIVALTYPSVRDFFESHVIGDTPINYNDFFEKVGLEIGEGKAKTDYIQNAGKLILNINPENATVFFNNLVSKNSFWREQGVQPNDVVKSVEGTLVTLQNANQIFGEVFLWKPGKEVSVTLTRNGKDIIIKTTLTQSYTTGKTIIPKTDASESQIALRKTWLKG